LAQQELRAQWVVLEPLVWSVALAPGVRLAPQGRRVHREQQVVLVLLAGREPLEPRDAMVLQDQRGLLAWLDALVEQEPLV